MSDPVREHRAAAPSAVGCAVVTMSDSRTEQTDTSGALIVELLEGQGHQVVQRAIIPDEPDRLRELLHRFAADEQVQAVLITGGTGISPRDQTYETVSAELTKTLPGFGELFRMLSYEEIGAAAMLSRAVAGLIGGTVVFVMPGSRGGVRTAIEGLVLSELGHLVREATKR